MYFTAVRKFRKLAHLDIRVQKTGKCTWHGSPLTLTQRHGSRGPLLYHNPRKTLVLSRRQLQLSQSHAALSLSLSSQLMNEGWHCSTGKTLGKKSTKCIRWCQHLGQPIRIGWMRFTSKVGISPDFKVNSVLIGRQISVKENLVNEKKVKLSNFF